jgi:hypothetical protein
MWIASLENKINQSNTNIVISDCRFPNEIQAIRDLGGCIIRVQRGDLPEWYGDAELAVQGSNIGINNLKIKKIHYSEWAWIGSKFDIHIDNNGTVDDLYGQISDVVTNKLQIKITQS